MSDEEKQVEEAKKNLTEMIKKEVFQLTGKNEVMKIIRKELQKEIRSSVKFYLSQIMPDDEEVSEIVRQVFLAMGKKRGNKR